MIARFRKYVPKLLKELIESGCLEEPQAELLKKAKDAVMGKAAVSEEEIVELKKMASEAATAGAEIRDNLEAKDNA